MTSEQQSRAAWDAFWVRNGDAGGTSRSGCLPAAWQGIDHVQTGVWTAFAKGLPKGARVLDLGTGDGRVMARLLDARRDLKPVGIDQANELPAPPRGSKVRTGVLMSDLPFPDCSFAAVTSQFAFEYGDIDKGAREVARVLRPGGSLGIIAHRTDGPIVAHNRGRREQIDWVLARQGLPAIARRSLQLWQAGMRSVPPELQAAPQEGARQFGEGSAAWEIAEAIRRSMIAGIHTPAAHTAAVIDEIVAQANNEMGRIKSLEMAAEASGRGEKLAAALVGAGLQLQEQRDLVDGTAPNPFATLLIFTRPA